MFDHWIQIKGDPSIRRFLFEQERENNELDQYIDGVVASVTELICQYGVFHAKIHFSSGQLTLWFIADPTNYQVIIKEDFLKLDLNKRFPEKSYPEKAVVDKNLVRTIFESFKILRTRDPQIYLRSGSLNIINGMVGMNFSCDGSHYMQYDAFLNKVGENF